MKKNNVTVMDLWGRKVTLVDTVNVQTGFIQIYNDAEPYEGRFELKTGDLCKNFYWVQLNDISAAFRRGELGILESSLSGWNMAEEFDEARRMWGYILANALTFSEVNCV